MKIHGRAPHRATFRTDYYAVELPEGREWSDAESNLKVKYEFGKLTKDKATALAVKLGKTEPVTEDMALCDVYNLGTDNGGEQIE